MLVALIRTMILYAVVIFAIRLMGKRQIGELEPSEFVVTLLVSELASVPMQELGTPLLYGIVPIITLLCMSLLISAGTLKSLKFRILMCGKPSLLMANGRILQKELRKNRLTVDELIEELRAKDITDLSTVQYAILETNGTLSTILYPLHQPATREDVRAEPVTNGLPVIVVNDGALLKRNCERCGLRQEWIGETLRQYGLTDIKDVFLLLVDEGNNVYCLPKEEKR